MNLLTKLLFASIPISSRELKSGTARTTRFWDCSGGSCGCGYGNNQNPRYCNSGAMFEAPKDNIYGAKYYGTAAISQSLGGGDWLAKGCGKCFKVTGKSNIKGFEN